MTDSRIAEIKSAGERIAQAAQILKETADQLRADVDALTDRVLVIEEAGVSIADELVISNERIQDEQLVQNDRLDTLED